MTCETTLGHNDVRRLLRTELRALRHQTGHATASSIHPTRSSTALLFSALHGQHSVARAGRKTVERFPVTKSVKASTPSVDKQRSF